jgi:N-acetylneuraminate synthase
MNFLGHDLTGSNPPLIVAEIGSGHCGTLDSALGLLDDVEDAGAGAIKIQTYTADSMTIDCGEADFVVKGGPWRGQKLYDLYGKACTPREWHKPLFERAAAKGIPIFSSPFSVADVEFLEGLRCPAYKIASAEIGHLRLLEAVRATRKPVVISTGMASDADISTALEALYGREVIILHCVSGYPTPTHEANLHRIGHLARRFPTHVIGFSDHTRGFHAASIAVALGARLIEKHIGETESEDGDFAVNPVFFGEFRRQVLTAHRAVQPCDSLAELPTWQMKRSIYVIQPVKRGEALTDSNISVIRPGYGLEPEEFDSVIGKKALIDLERGMALTKAMFK